MCLSLHSYPFLQTPGVGRGDSAQWKATFVPTREESAPLVIEGIRSKSRLLASLPSRPDFPIRISPFGLDTKLIHERAKEILPMWL